MRVTSVCVCLRQKLGAIPVKSQKVVLQNESIKISGWIQGFASKAINN